MIKNRLEKTRAVPKCEGGNSDGLRKSCIFIGEKECSKNSTYLQKEMSTAKAVSAALRHNAGHCSAFGQDFTDAADLCANAFEFFLNPLIAAVNVVDAIYYGFTIGNQRGDNQRG